MGAVTTVGVVKSRRRLYMDLLCMLSKTPAAARDIQGDLGGITYGRLKSLVGSLNRRGYGVVCETGPAGMGRVVYVGAETWTTAEADATEYFETRERDQ